MKLVYCWKIQEDPVKGSITLVNFRTQFSMVHVISSIVLCKCPENQFTSMMDKNHSMDWRQHLWEIFIYYLGENKLKRVHDKKKQKELRIAFKELSWKCIALWRSSVEGSIKLFGLQSRGTWKGSSFKTHESCRLEEGSFSERRVDELWW